MATGVRLCLVAGLALAGALATAGDPARAQGSTELVDELVACTAIEDPDERLACFDAVAEPLTGLTAEDGEDASESLYSFVGKDDVDTETVEIGESWRAVWKSEASVLTIELRGPEGDLIDTIGFQIGTGNGRSNVHSPGSYTFAIRGAGNWRVDIVAAE